MVSLVSEPTAVTAAAHSSDRTTRGAAPDRRTAALALLLLIPAPTLGTLAAMWPDDPGLLGKAAYAAAKVWLLGLPLVWLLLVERRPISRSPLRDRRGLLVGAGLGGLISVVILAVYWFVGRDLVDIETLRASAERSGIGTPLTFFAFMAYISLINALLEEYVWRWFVFRQWERLTPRRWAIVLAALSFTLHHVFALLLQMPVVPAALAAGGVFIGGVVWTWLYEHYRSVWPAYVSHLIVDVAIFALGGWLLFGAPNPT